MLINIVIYSDYSPNELMNASEEYLGAKVTRIGLILLPSSFEAIENIC